MFLRSLLLALASALAGCGGTDSGVEDVKASQLQTIADRAVASGLPGVVVAHVNLAEAPRGVAGVRQLGGTDKVEPNDAFLVGSTTKAMTSAIAGRLVERGIMAWTTTLAEALPEIAPRMHPAYRGVTLEQLLNHRGGVPAFDNESDVARFLAVLEDFEGDLPSTQPGRERFFAAWVLAQEPAARPGQDFLYSNAGYALASLMMQSRTGLDVAALFDKELAQPLGMMLTWTSADTVVSQRPVGHEGAKGALKPLALETAALSAWYDVLRASGVGTTTTVDSYATWVRWHLRALRGEKTPLATGYVERLKQLKVESYALGWVATDIEGRAVLVHNGEDLGFSTLLVVDGKGRSASFGFTNSVGREGDWVMQSLNQAIFDVEKAFSPAR